MTDAESRRSELRELIAREVKAGYTSEDEIREQALEFASEEGEPDDAVSDCIDDLLEQALDAQVAAQAGWTGLTDCDRLDAAFADLESSGIVSRQNWTCCQNCGHSEIRDEIKPASRGYVFFHQQDTERVVEDGALYLAYGACSNVREEQLVVANEIARTLREQGLKVEWDGSLEKRILVKLEWKRRRRAD